MHTETVNLSATIHGCVANVAVLQAEQTGTTHHECHLIIGVLHDITVNVDHFYEDMSHAVSRQPQGGGSTAGSDFVDSSVDSLTAQSARMILDVTIEYIGLWVTLELDIKRMTVQRQTGIIGVGIANHTDTLSISVVPCVGGIGTNPWIPVTTAITASLRRSRISADVTNGLFAPQ